MRIVDMILEKMGLDKMYKSTGRVVAFGGIIVLFFLYASSQKMVILKDLSPTSKYHFDRHSDASKNKI